MKKFEIEMEKEYNGIKYVVLFTSNGHRCGYVGIDKDNVLYEKDYSDKLTILSKEDVEGQEIGKRGIIPLLMSFDDDEDDNSMRMDCYFDVHGGITYSGGGLNSKYPIESNLWWIGFDCAHCDDGKDLDLAYQYELIPLEQKEAIQQIENMYPTYGTIRTLEYVEQECKNLIDQICKLKGE